MNSQTVLQILTMLIFIALGAFLWYFFKCIELSLKSIQDCLKQISDDLYKLERNLR